MQQMLYNNNCISIHSLRMEGDESHPAISDVYYVFQSTPSAWRETTDRIITCHIFPISIHSLRMEGDVSARICISLFSISIHSLRMEGDIHGQ